jgi:hypothetical protein
MAKRELHSASGGFLMSDGAQERETSLHMLDFYL